MDEKLLREYLSNLSIRESRIKRVINTVRKFEKYLDKSSNTLDDATADVLEEFLYDYSIKYTSNYYIEDLRYYYEKKENNVMQGAIEKLRYKYTPPFNLSNFLIDEEYSKALNKRGIKTNNQLLNVCKTLKQRAKLSNMTKIPVDEVIRITKLSDLTRIYAVKETRAQLYYDAGIDTVDIIAKLDPTELRDIVLKYARDNNFSGVPTLPKEAEFTVNFARKLYKMVEW